MPSSNVLTLGDLPPKVIVDTFGVILVILFVAFPAAQSEKWQCTFTSSLIGLFGQRVGSFGEWTGYFSGRADFGAVGAGNSRAP
jgi:hypothetical protein